MLRTVNFIFFVLFSSTVLCLDIFCTDEYCQVLTLAAPCPNNDLEVCGNSSVAKIIDSLSECNCCELCLVYKNEGDGCISGTPGQQIPDTMCGPGLKCESKQCVKMDATMDPVTFPRYQCENQMCHCIAPEKDQNGDFIQIFGEFEESESIDNEEQCGCSVFSYLATQLANKALPYDGVPQAALRCLPNGQFDPLQCVNNMCACVDRETGVWDSTIQIVPTFVLEPNNPYCFDARLGHRKGAYYKQCEEERNQLVSKVLQMEEDSVHSVYGSKFSCRPDGEFLLQETEWNYL